MLGSGQRQSHGRGDPGQPGDASFDAVGPCARPTGRLALMGQNGTHGAVRVANEVIASIAALAACEVEGVADMDETAARHFGDWVRRQTAHRGVRVQVEADRSIHLEVFITVDSEGKLAEVASGVQATVVEATERMLGLEVGEVNVFVSSVAFAD
jgi:uncharacterized alkaline shock family protein YloU